MSQNANNTFRVPSPDDAKLLEILEKMANALNTEFSLSIAGVNVGSFTTAADAKVELRRDLDGARLITSATMTAERFVVNFHRHVTQFGSPMLIEPSNWEAEFCAYRQNHETPNPGPKVLAIASIVDEYRREFTSKIKPAQAPKDFTDIYARQLAELTELHTKIVRDAEEARQRGQQEVEEQRRQQEAEAAAERSRIKAELEEARRIISNEEAALARRKQEIDDRSHMHARRQMRDAITAELKSRQKLPAVSKNTTALRSTILAVCITIFTTLGWLAVLSGNEALLMIQTNKPLTSPFFAVIIRGALLTLGAVGAAWYALSFLRKIHDEDLRAERDLERYLYDVDRASWAIETVLEAQRREGEQDAVEIPQEWVEGVTRGLFQRADSRDPEELSLAALGSIFNFAAEAEVGPGGTKVRFNKPGLKAMKRRAEATEG